jgi:hypothetical protein
MSSAGVELSANRRAIHLAGIVMVMLDPRLFPRYAEPQQNRAPGNVEIGQLAVNPGCSSPTPGTPKPEGTKAERVGKGTWGCTVTGRGQVFWLSALVE